MAAPIALFVYNRPEHTRKTIVALQRNDLAKDSVLYVFCDGPKSDATDEELERLKKTQEIVASIKGFQRVELIKKEFNIGLAQSIREGVGHVLSLHETIIVMEDDILVSEGFLEFMNNALEMYRNDPKVMHISGYWFPVKKSTDLPETFFLQLATCWGWATWRDAWAKFDASKDYISHLEADSNLLQRFDIDGVGGYFSQLIDNKLNKINTWAIFWYASIFFHDGLSLHPNKSFVNNIGHDGSGEHCYVTSSYTWPVLNENGQLEKVDLNISQPAQEKLKKFFQPMHKSGLKHRVRNAIN